DGENICRYDDNIRIKYYGGTKDTKDKARCGLKALDGLGSTGVDWIDDIVNSGGSLISYKRAIRKFNDMGYSEGFSMAGVPQDFRRYVTKNTFNIQSLTYHINRMYEQTGKEVILVGHSYGCNAIYGALSTFAPELLKKIKKFVAMAPPFAGSSKLLSVFLNGMIDFNKEISIAGLYTLKTDYSRFAQHIMYGAVPVIPELTPLPVINQWLNGTNYKAFSEAILERIDLLNECRDKNCDAEYIKEHSQKFSLIYGKDFPSFLDEECKIPVDHKKNLGEAYFQDYACRMRIYKEGLCPSLLKKTEGYEPKPSDFEDLCGVHNESLLYAETCGEHKGHNCLDNIFAEAPYPYRDTEKVNYLLDRYNTQFAKDFGGEKLNASYFEDIEKYRKKVVTQVNYHRQIRLHKELPIPPVDTVIMYGEYLKTSSGLIYDPNRVEETEPEEGEKQISGGDETVPNWSTFIVGLKWLFDKKRQQLPQNVTIVEYCSKLGQKGSQYAYDRNKSQTFYALRCDCLNYRGEFDEAEGCTHSGMLGDDKLIDWLADISIDDKNDKTERMIEAAKNYVKKDFIGECNEQMYQYGNPLEP
ncbi:MAG: hypothetical protein MJ252_28260, partial [archaeon]|nr:hypothetical protein [archaeon]